MNHPDVYHQLARERIERYRREASDARLARSVERSVVTAPARRAAALQPTLLARLRRPAFLRLARG